MKKFILYSELKPEKVEEYADLHRNAWPEICKIIQESNMHDYSISIIGNKVFTMYTYTGDDYDADMKKMEEYPIMLEWWSHTRPCFSGHSEGKYYDDMEEVFFLP